MSTTGSLVQRRHIAIIGMGYIGTSLAAALAHMGHQVVGVERDPQKLQQLIRGESYVREPGVAYLLSDSSTTANLRFVPFFSLELAAAVELAIVCVGPSRGTSEDQWDVAPFRQVVEEIGAAARTRRSSNPLNTIIAATIRPQDYDLAADIIGNQQLDTPQNQVLLAVCPLFLREGSMLADLQVPPFIITGTGDGYSNTATLAWRDTLLDLVDPALRAQYPVHQVTAGVASMVKLASNAYHALKVCFANEVGRIAYSHRLDAQVIMEVFIQDRLLNISALYLRPGFAFGGSCLDKDIHGLLTVADTAVAETCQLLNSLQLSNKEHIRQASQLIIEQAELIKQDRLGFLGLTFKTGTDDLRASPTIELINLLPRKYRVFAVDPDLPTPLDSALASPLPWQATLESANILLLDNLSHLALSCQVLVIAKPALNLLDDLLPLLTARHCVIDLVGEVTSSTLLPCPVYRFV